MFTFIYENEEKKLKEKQCLKRRRKMQNEIFKIYFLIGKKSLKNE